MSAFPKHFEKATTKCPLWGYQMNCAILPGGMIRSEPFFLWENILEPGRLPGEKVAVFTKKFLCFILPSMSCGNTFFPSRSLDIPVSVEQGAQLYSWTSSPWRNSFTGLFAVKQSFIQWSFMIWVYNPDALSWLDFCCAHFFFCAQKLFCCPVKFLAA